MTYIPAIASQPPPVKCPSIDDDAGNGVHVLGSLAGLLAPAEGRSLLAGPRLPSHTLRVLELDVRTFADGETSSVYSFLFLYQAWLVG